MLYESFSIGAEFRNGIKGVSEMSLFNRENGTIVLGFFKSEHNSIVYLDFRLFGWILIGKC